LRPVRISWLAGLLFCCSMSGLAQVRVEIGPLEPVRSGESILIRVMTYNLHHGVDALNRSSLEKIAVFIRDNRIDLVGLQEVDRNWSERSGFRDQAMELASATGLNLAFLPTLTRGTQASYGMAVLSRFPLLAQSGSLYSQAQEPRGYLTVTVGIAERPVNFIVTHLGLDATERLSQVGELGKALNSLPGPLILVGDMNGGSDDPAVMAILANLRDALQEMGRGSRGTLIANNGAVGARIDFLLATPEFHIENCLVPEINLSDHRPVVAFLSLYLDPSPGLNPSQPT